MDNKKDKLSSIKKGNPESKIKHVRVHICLINQYSIISVCYGFFIPKKGQIEGGKNGFNMLNESCT